MFRGCVPALGLYLGLATAYYFWLDRVFDPPGSVVGAGVMGLIAMLGLGALINSKNAWRQSSLAADARHDLPWSDGRMAAVSGTIHPLHEPLLAPFSGQECVLCEYEIKEARGASPSKDESTGVDLTGFLMNPCVVRSRMGDVRLLGFPHLEGFREAVCGSYQAARRARDFVASTQFEDGSGLKLGKLFSALMEVWTDDDGLVQKHLRITKRDPRSLFPAGERLDALAAAEGPLAAADEVLTEEAEEEDFHDEDFEDDLDVQEGDEELGKLAIPRLVEKRVAVGQEVTAFGIYSGANRGLLPAGRGADRFIRLLRGRAEQSATTLRQSAVRNFVGGLLALAALHGIAYGVMQAAWHNPTEQTRRQSELFEAARNGNLPRLKKLHARGVDINLRTADGYTPLHLAGDAAVAQWLAENGADLNAASNLGETPLMFAARQGRADIARVLIAARADLSVQHPDDGKTALMLAEDAGHDQIARMLSEAQSAEASQAP